jgi:hypothetical protein
MIFKIVLLHILDDLRTLCETYHERISTIEYAKYDTEKEVEFKEYQVYHFFKTSFNFIGVFNWFFLKSRTYFLFFQITDLNMAVNDLRGKL